MRSFRSLSSRFPLPGRALQPIKPGVALVRLGARRAVLLACLVAMMPLGSACTYQRAYIAYADNPGQVPLSAAPFDGEVLGVVTASESGQVWKDCTKVAEAAVWVLIDETRRLGGNAVGNIRWFPTRPTVTPDRPMCRQRWGWVLVWPMLLTPAFQVAQAEATAYRVADPVPAAGLYLLPETRSDDADLVDRIVRETANLAY
jgi:hypothetical protein